MRGEFTKEWRDTMLLCDYDVDHRFPVISLDFCHVNINVDKSKVVPYHVGVESQSSICWDVVNSHREQAFKNHNQTLEKLAENGGLSWSELYFVLCNSKYDSNKFYTDLEARPYVLNIENMVLGHVGKYVIQSNDNVRLLLNSFYRCDVSLSNVRLLHFCLMRLNSWFKTFADIKVGRVLNVPILFVSQECETHIFYGVKRNIDVDCVNNSKRYDSCNACLSRTEDVFEISIGCNNSTVKSCLCRNCLRLLYKQIGDELQK